MTANREVRVAERREDPPFEGGAQPVPENPPEVATRGRTVMQTVVLVVSGLLVLAAVAWLLVPLLR